MKLQIFFDKFELFADAPNAVQKMRELVLELAVQGKLVEQDSKELSAIQYIRKANKPIVEAIPDANVKAPAGWVALRLGCVIASNTGGGTPSKQNPSYWNGSIPWASVKDIQSEKYLVSTIDSITQEGLKNSSSNLILPNRLIVVTRMGLGKLAINKIPVAINQDLRAIEPTTALDLDFAYLLFKSLKMVGTGMTVKGITVDNLHAMTVLLPPLAEQRRIVAKVDELMALCDRLEAQHQQRSAQHTALARAAVSRFADAPTPANLDFIFHNAYAITPADLRKTILTLAVQGKLVPQDASDESADKLLERIAIKRTSLLKAAYPNRDESSTQLRKQESQALPDNLEPLALGWTWATLIQTSLLVVDCHNKTAPYVAKGIRLLRTTNIRNGQLNLIEPKFVDEVTYERWSARCKPEAGDILITREAPMGEVCIIPEGMKVCLGQRMMLIRVAPGTMDTKYLLYSLMAPDLMDRVQDKPVGATVQHLRVGGVETVLTPIPPLAEQQRIVAKVDELMKLVDQLEQQLGESKALSERLLDAAVHEALQAGITAKQLSAAVDRAALGCYVLKRMHSNPSFARTAEVKVLYLAEAHLGLSLGGQWYRKAAGPLDEWVYDFERQADKEGWFKTSHERLSGGHTITRYQLQQAIQAKVDQAATELGEKRQEFDRLLDSFKSLSTEDIEIIATLFAAWNDALIDGEQPSDSWIVREVRENWHPSKQRFSPEKLTTWLSWMRNHGLIPVGLGRRTIYQPGFELID